MACKLCSSLVIDYSKAPEGREITSWDEFQESDHEIALPFEVREVYPGLPQLTRNSDDGCDFCRLLVQLLDEYCRKQNSDDADRSLDRPVHLQLKHARFRLHSANNPMVLSRQKTWINGVWLLIMELYYGERPEPKEMFFQVFSDNGGMSQVLSRSRASGQPGLTITDKCIPEQFPIRRRLRRPIEEDPLSENSVSLMREWIRKCVKGHPECSMDNDGFNPTRLLDVRDSDDIVLRYTRDAEPLEWVALSHCWGAQIAEKPMLTTNTATIEERMTKIPMNMYAYLEWPSSGSSG